MIDLNSQLFGDLPTIADIDVLVSLAGRMRQDGVEKVVATMKIPARSGADTLYARHFEHRIDELRKRLTGDSIETPEIIPGYEWSFSEDLNRRIRAFESGPTIGGSHYLLVNLPSSNMPVNWRKVFEALIGEGYVPIIARPECSRALRRQSVLIQTLVELGCLMQVDALSVTGGYTNEIEIFTRKLLESRYVHFIATRAGFTATTEVSLKQAYERAAMAIGAEPARRLVRENPAAVLADVSMESDRRQTGSLPALETAWGASA